MAYKHIPQSNNQQQEYSNPLTTTRVATQMLISALLLSMLLLTQHAMAQEVPPLGKDAEIVLLRLLSPETHASPNHSVIALPDYFTNPDGLWLLSLTLFLLGSCCYAMSTLVHKP